MPLNDRYPKSVVFVLGVGRAADGSQTQVAIGTAFYVGVPFMDGEATWVYLVTAAHVVEGQTETWVRVTTRTGQVETVPVPEWRIHPTADVAVAIAGNVSQVDLTVIPEATFLDRWSHRPSLGDRVYFIGLLAMATSMVESNIPLVRSGTVGRLNQQRVPLQHRDGRVTHHDAHLIDCRSYGGFSGSPCFVQFQRKEGEGAGPGVYIGGVSAIPETACLGLISGHWDDMVRVRPTGEAAHDELVESIRFPINTGVGIVTPVDKVRECLMDDEFVAQRASGEKQLREKARQDEKDNAATADSIGGDPPMTKTDFEAALRKVSRRKASPPDEGK